eukprot:959613_1
MDNNGETNYKQQRQALNEQKPADRFPDLTRAFSIFTYYKSKDGTCLLSSLNYLWQHAGHADSIITLPKASEVSFVLHSTRPNNMSAADAGFKIHVGLVQDCASFASSDCVLTGNSSLFVKLDSLSKSAQGKVVSHTCHQSRKATVTVRRMNPSPVPKIFLGGTNILSSRSSRPTSVC